MKNKWKIWNNGKKLILIQRQQQKTFFYQLTLIEYLNLDTKRDGKCGRQFVGTFLLLMESINIRSLTLLYPLPFQVKAEGEKIYFKMLVELKVPIEWHFS